MGQDSWDIFDRWGRKVGTLRPADTRLDGAINFIVQVTTVCFGIGIAIGVLQILFVSVIVALEGVANVVGLSIIGLGMMANSFVNAITFEVLGRATGGMGAGIVFGTVGLALGIFSAVFQGGSWTRGATVGFFALVFGGVLLAGEARSAWNGSSTVCAEVIATAQSHAEAASRNSWSRSWLKYVSPGFRGECEREIVKAIVLAQEKCTKTKECKHLGTLDKFGKPSYK